MRAPARRSLGDNGLGDDANRLGDDAKQALRAAARSGLELVLDLLTSER